MLTGPVVSPLVFRRSCSKNGTIAAGFSIGSGAAFSIISATSSEALARAFALTTGGRGAAFFFLTTFFLGVALDVELDCERSRSGVIETAARIEAVRSHRITVSPEPELARLSRTSLAYAALC